VQVQRWLGHHSPSFTLDTYVHLLDNHLGEPLHEFNRAQAGQALLDVAADVPVQAVPADGR